MKRGKQNNRGESENKYSNRGIASHELYTDLMSHNVPFTTYSDFNHNFGFIIRQHQNTYPKF